MRGLAIAALCLIAAQPLLAQNFSCRIGTRAACLEFGDTVCSSRGMCVDSNAACFDQFQCDFRGFTCRSNVIECQEEFDALVDESEALLRRYNALVDDFNRLQDENRELVESQDVAQFCILRASTLEAARACL